MWYLDAIFVLIVSVGIIVFGISIWAFFECIENDSNPWKITFITICVFFVGYIFLMAYIIEKWEIMT